MWHGTVVARNGHDEYALSADLAFDLDDTPLLVNVSHPLWTQSAARVEYFTRHVPDETFAIPRSCFKALDAV